MMNSQTVSDTLSEHEDIHVEIEHVAEETGGLDSDDGLDTSPTSNATHLQGKLHLYTRVQGKRTVILPHQRKILEEFYRTGMVSASHNLHHLHEAAADQTGLELYVIKNWVRNRRRPSAAQKRQDLHDMSITNTSLISQGPLTTLSTIPLPNITTVTIPTPHLHPPPPLIIPEPKRVCIDGLVNNIDIGSKLFLVKVRIADSGESDFVEVDVYGISYHDLLKSCCEELEVHLEEVSKLRKLPNILIRKDRDVARLDNGQELELVLKGGGISTMSQTIMAINPFSANSSVHLIPMVNTDSNNLLTLDGQTEGSTNTNHS